MSNRDYAIFNIATGLLKGAILGLFVLWLLPMWGINIPTWWFILIVVAFLTYETITFRLDEKAQQKQPEIGAEALVGRRGRTITPLTPAGYVRVDGELWHALSVDTNTNKGEDIVVVELDRLTLLVAPLGPFASPGLQPAAQPDPPRFSQ